MSHMVAGMLKAGLTPEKLKDMFPGVRVLFNGLDVTPEPTPRPSSFKRWANLLVARMRYYMADQADLTAFRRSKRAYAQAKHAMEAFERASHLLAVAEED